MSTLFTKIIEGELPGNFVWKDDQCVVFASIDPITPGHMLVVPRLEVAKFTDAPDDLLGHLMVVAKAVGRAGELAYDAPRAVMIIAGFDVDHLHLHVLPAWGQDQMTFARAQRATPEQLADSCAKIRAALRELGYAQVSD
ncbi:MAG: HIT family protein [Propionibacteriaceae bacterium]|nr:HIT family protein [Propionibacteriaceae bacterium]